MFDAMNQAGSLSSTLAGDCWLQSCASTQHDELLLLTPPGALHPSDEVARVEELLQSIVGVCAWDKIGKRAVSSLDAAVVAEVLAEAEGRAFKPVEEGYYNYEVKEYGYRTYFKTEEDHRAKFDEVKAKHVAQWKAFSSLSPLTLSQTYHGQAKQKEATERVFVARGEYLALVREYGYCGDDGGYFKTEEEHRAKFDEQQGYDISLYSGLGGCLTVEEVTLSKPGAGEPAEQVQAVIRKLGLKELFEGWGRGDDF